MCQNPSWLWSTALQTSSTCAKGKCTYLIVIVCRLSIFPVSAFIFSTLTLNISQPLHCHSIISSVLLVALVIQHFFRTVCHCCWWIVLPCHNGPLAKKNHTGLQDFLSLTHGVKAWSFPMSCSLYNCFRWSLNGLFIMACNSGSYETFPQSSSQGLYWWNYL